MNGEPGTHYYRVTWHALKNGWRVRVPYYALWPVWKLGRLFHRVWEPASWFEEDPTPLPHVISPSPDGIQRRVYRSDPHAKWTYRADPEGDDTHGE